MFTNIERKLLKQAEEAFKVANQEYLEGYLTTDSAWEADEQSCQLLDWIRELQEEIDFINDLLDEVLPEVREEIYEIVKPY